MPLNVIVHALLCFVWHYYVSVIAHIFNHFFSLNSNNHEINTGCKIKHKMKQTIFLSNVRHFICKKLTCKPFNDKGLIRSGLSETFI